MDELIGQHTNGKSICRVVRTSALPDDMRKGVRELVGMYTSPKFRGMGYASKLLDEVVKKADTSQLSIMIAVKPFDSGLSQDDLTKFYARKGFQEFQKTPLLMVRPCQSQ